MDMIIINTITQKYKNFHDAVVEEVLYDVNNQKATIILDVLNFFYEGISKREKLKITFNNVKNLTIKEMFPWDFIKEAVLEETDNGNLIYFATDKEDPWFSVVCESMVTEII